MTPRIVLPLAAAFLLSACGSKALKEEVATLKSNLAEIHADSDGDGVPDALDKEANTAKGALVDGSGRALDLDGDGVRHELDLDPFSQRGVKVDPTGMELDSDFDGVPNSKDLEPNTPSGALVNFQGKKIETKGMSMKVAEAFIPEVSFATNSVTIGPEQEARMMTVDSMMKSNPTIQLQEVGHADKTGSERVNLRIAERRAKAVIKVLTTTYGIAESRLELVSMGEGDPISTKNQHNRRVEFRFVQ
jgi:OOP family OmpA-OmpF porin